VCKRPLCGLASIHLSVHSLRPRAAHWPRLGAPQTGRNDSIWISRHQGVGGEALTNWTNWDFCRPSWGRRLGRVRLTDGRPTADEQRAGRLIRLDKPDSVGSSASGEQSASSPQEASSHQPLQRWIDARPDTQADWLRAALEGHRHRQIDGGAAD